MKQGLRIAFAAAFLLPIACGSTGADVTNTPAPTTGGSAGASAAGTGGKSGSSAAGAAGASGAGAGGTAGKGGAGGGAGGATPCSGADSDGDTIADSVEGTADPDKDGKPNQTDDDSDGDGIPDKVEAGRTDVCAPPFDSDSDGVPDYLDTDSDNDGVPDQDEKGYDPDGSKGCALKPDCDGDGVVDVVEVAAGSNPVDGKSLPPDATLYFVLPYAQPEKTKDFSFSTGVKEADVYFLVDTTASMGPAIANVAGSLDTKIIPGILNGDAKASPPIPGIPGARLGAGEFRDVPWAPYGEAGDAVYRHKFGATLGNVTKPEGAAPNFTAPANVKTILSQLKAGGGGDAPEGTTQALWMAVTGKPYQATLGGLWKSEPPSCADPKELGTPCFRPDAVPIFVLITDAPFHAGPQAANDYDPKGTGGTVSYADTVDALKQRNAKVIGVAVDTGLPGAARADLSDLAVKTGSVYYDPAFGGSEKPLVTTQDTMSGDVSSEVVRLVGLLAGQGLNDVTTARTNYDCAGGVDCTGDGVADPVYHNPGLSPGAPPIDATQFVTKVEPIESTQTPLPYATLDGATFFGVRGDATVTFRVHAKNDTLNPQTLLVLRATIQVQTPGGQKLGGALGVKQVYIVIPRDANILK